MLQQENVNFETAAAAYYCYTPLQQAMLCSAALVVMFLQSRGEWWLCSPPPALTRPLLP